MSPWNWLRRWKLCEPSQDRFEEDIDDELEFHFLTLVEENLEKGMPPADALHAARERFGSLQRYSSDCRRLRSSGKGWIAPAAIVVSLALGLASWNAMQVRALLQAQKNARRANDAALRTNLSAADVSGCVVDAEERPVSGAEVLAVLKTWPDGRYRQQALCVQADGDGAFRLPNVVPDRGPYALHVAAFKEGFAFASTYRLVDEESPRAFAPTSVRLAPAVPLTLVVQDDFGRPAAHARIAPQSRRSPQGQNHLVYFQASGPVQQTTDAEGRIRLGCFERGDRAEFYIQLPGRDWIRRTVDIPAEGDVVLVSTKAPPHADRP